MTADNEGPSGRSRGTPPEAGLLGGVTASLQQGRELIAGVAEVAALEGRLAALSLVQMAALAVTAALLAVSAWGLLLAALAFALARAGIPWLWLLPAMAVLNGLLAWWAVHRLRRLGGDLGFNSTRQLLQTLPTPFTEQTRAADTTDVDQESRPAAP